MSRAELGARGRGAALVIGVVLGAGLAGCACARSHEVSSDASTDAPATDGPQTDAPATDAADEPCPGPAPRPLRVRVEPADRCALEELEGELLGPLRAAPDVDGVELAIDGCDAPGVDCVCTLVIEGVGADLASRSTLARGPARIVASPTRAVVVARHDGGEAGTYPEDLALYVDEALLDGPSAVDGVSLASAEACVVSEGACARARYDATVSIDERASGWPDWTRAGSIALAEGELRAVEGTFASVRLLWARAERCAGEAAPPRGAWAIVWSYPPAP